jgi:hypothetical protein
MTNAKKQADEIAQLKKEVAELKAKVSPPKSEFKPISDAEWRNQVHQARERQMNSWMPPNAVQDLVNGEPPGFMAGVVKDNRNAPTSPTGMIPRESGARAPVPSPTPGWSDPAKLGPPPGVAQADKLMDEQDRRDRAELAQRLGALKR